MSENGDKKTIWSLANLMSVIAIAGHTITWTFLFNIHTELFHHLTNADLHPQKSKTVSIEEFAYYKLYRDVELKRVADESLERYKEIDKSLTRLETLLNQHMFVTPPKK